MFSLFIDCLQFQILADATVGVCIVSIWSFDPVSSLLAKGNNDNNKLIFFISISHYDRELNYKGNNETCPKMFWKSFCYIKSLACLAFTVVEILKYIHSFCGICHTFFYLLQVTSSTSVWILSGLSWWPTRRNGRADFSNCWEKSCCISWFQRASDKNCYRTWGPVWATPRGGSLCDHGLRYSRK